MLRPGRHAYRHGTVPGDVSRHVYRGIPLVQHPSVPDREAVTIGAITLTIIGDDQDTPGAVKCRASKGAVVAKNRPTDEHRSKKKRTGQHKRPRSWLPATTTTGEECSSDLG